MVVATMATGCSPDRPTATAPDRVPARSPSPTPSDVDAGRDDPVRAPPPGAAIPSNPARLATELRGTTGRLAAAIADWRAAGLGRSGSAADVVEHYALYQQRLYRALVARPGLAARVLARLPSRWRRIADRNITAGAELRSLVTPVRSADRFRTLPPDPPRRLRRYYAAAERRFGIDWEVLAALNFVESKFGRLPGPSVAGARGPMQFLPSTWDAYGLGGDIMDPRDAILGAANYLSASGAPQRLSDALFAYNRSYEYVRAVRLYAREIKRDPDNYLAYYHWQVFIATTKGDVRVTGPGR